MPESWKTTLPCTRAEAESLADQELYDANPDAELSIVTREIEARYPDKWAVDIYSSARPTKELLKKITQLSPSGLRQKIKPQVERLGDEDWVTISQTGLEPLRAGRFHVHTGNDEPSDDPEAVNLRIDASQAFGTGHHETTLGCLETLDLLKRRGGHFRNIIDVGTGTGLLALAARHLWPTARLIASDLDPVAVDISKYNADLNNVPSGSGRNALALVASNGMDHRMIRMRAPYDLIIANILARPLIALAPQIAAAAAPGASLVLAGLLADQQVELLTVFRKHGFRLTESRVNGDWPCLLLKKRARYRQISSRRPIYSPLPEGSFGEW
ncbi:50S ribosomal protein L11 methyltransferase [Parasphingorhabdus sp.]